MSGTVPPPVSTVLAKGFWHSHLVWIRIVDKHRRPGRETPTKSRVLLLTAKSLYLCHLDNNLTRWLMFSEIEEVFVLPRKRGDCVLVKGKPPEHDILVYLCPHEYNLPVHAPADDFVAALRKHGVAVSSWQGTEEELVASAQLAKRTGFVSPSRKLEMRQSQSGAPSPAASSQKHFPSAPPSIQGLPTPAAPAAVAAQSGEPVQTPAARDITPPQQQLPPLRPDPASVSDRRLSASAWAPPGPTRALLVSSAEPGAAAAQRVTCDFLRRHRGGDVRLLGGLSQEPATKHSVLRALSWLVSGCADGDSLWLSLALPAHPAEAATDPAAPGSVQCGIACDDGVISAVDLWKACVSPLPHRARLTVVLDSVPQCPALFPLPYVLYTAGARAHTARREAVHWFPAAAAEVVVMAAAAGDGGSVRQGELTAALIRVAAEGLSHRRLVERAREILVRDNGEGVECPLITCSRPLAPDGLFHLHPPPVSVSSTQAANYRPGESVQVSSPLNSAPLSLQQQQPPAQVADAALLAQRGQVAATSDEDAAALAALPVPLQAPFVDLSLPPPQSAFEPVEQDEDFWRNMVCHAFLMPSAFDGPHVIVSSSHTGTQLRLNHDYVMHFVAQWPRVHPLLCHVRMTPDGGQHVIARSFYTSAEFWEFLRDQLHHLLGQRALQRTLYPHARDASRADNVVLSMSGSDEELTCNADDWGQVVSLWEQEKGFSFTKTSLPVPLMPPFKLPLDEDMSATFNAPEHDQKIVAALRRDLAPAEGDGTAKSLSFQYDADLVRNLAYHSRLMPGARNPPLFIVEDSGLSHPLLINQHFLCRYVLSWGKVHPHMVWVHECDRHTLVARCRTTEDFWKFLCERGPALQARMGAGRLVETVGSDGQLVCRLAMHLLTVTSSASPEALTLWDGVWCAVLQEWESSLAKADPMWSPRRTRASVSPDAQLRPHASLPAQKPPAAAQWSSSGTHSVRPQVPVHDHSSAVFGAPKWSPVGSGAAV